MAHTHAWLCICLPLLPQGAQLEWCNEVIKVISLVLQHSEFWPVMHDPGWIQLAPDRQTDSLFAFVLRGESSGREPLTLFFALGHAFLAFWVGHSVDTG